MYVRYPNKSDTLKGISANMPPVKTCHSSPVGNGCHVGRFLFRFPGQAFFFEELFTQGVDGLLFRVFYAS
jgi:hypothetical protein